MVSSPPRRLLLATERSEHDAGAERVAIALAQRLGRALEVVLPLQSNPAYLVAAPDVALQAVRTAVAALDELQAQARTQGVAAETAVREGENPWEVIVAAARERQPDLLITRRVGQRGLLARFLVGEMVSQVAANAPCPQVMVPATATGLWSGRVLVAQADANRPAGILAATLAADCGLQLETCAAEDLAVRAGERDLVAIAVGVDLISAGRLAKSVIDLIGSVACPTLLVREDAPAAGGPSEGA